MTTTAAPSGTVTYRDVFAVREWRALWLAQVVSIAGDQFAAIALAVLVYGRTGSPLLAAAVFAATSAAQVVSGLLICWVADAYPRRAVMIACDLACAGLVLVMLIPGLPDWGLIALLFAVALALEPFLSARMATNATVLGPDRFQQGQAVTIATYQVAQFAGFALGGLVTATAGVRTALAVDAASFAVSALLVRTGVKARPAPEESAGRPEILAGTRIMLSGRAPRILLGLMCLVGFFAAPLGVIVPLGAASGGASRTGLLLGAMFAGGTIGPLAYTRLIATRRRERGIAVVATAACAVLILFAFSPPLGAAAVILVLAGMCTGYIPVAGAILFRVLPEQHHGKAGGVLGAGMALSQGVLILVAGAVAQHVSPAVVIAWCGVAGTVCGALLAIAWRRVRYA